MVFECKKCGYCCKNGIIVLYPEDIVKISSYLRITRKEFVDKYVEKTELILDNNKCIDICFFNLEKKCHFLSEDNLCIINSVKPLQCLYGPNSYFNSIGTWKNCIQYLEHDTNPFDNCNTPDDFFVKKLLEGYVI